MTAEAQSTPSSRRAVLAAGIAGVVALVAQAVGRPVAVRATDGQAVNAGNEGTLTATKTTGVTTSGGNGLQGVSADAGASGVYGQNDSLAGYGVAGRAGVNGVAVLADGGGTGLEVHGGPGKWAIAASNFWANGITIYVGGTAIRAEVHDVPGATVTDPTIGSINARNGTAVFGFSGTGGEPYPPAKTGLYGYAAQDNTAVGVMGGSGPGIGVKGSSTSNFGVRGDSTDGTGVAGVSDGGVGVAAISNGNRAVIGTSSAAAYPAILGHSRASNTGVQGFSGGASDVVPPAPSKVGIYGYANQDASAEGVLGRSVAGKGVHGSVGTGVGVLAEATSSAGFGLDVRGRARFSRSGRLAIAAGRSYITKTGIPLGSSTLVLAVLQTNRPGIYVRAAVANPATSSFTIYLNAAVPATTYVAWFVLG